MVLTVLEWAGAGLDGAALAALHRGNRKRACVASALGTQPAVMLFEP